ncbi:unnamed protein product [Effrenium voratum]|nr:unnamed protein product [Effrenium voratum]
MDSRRAIAGKDEESKDEEDEKPEPTATKLNHEGVQAFGRGDFPKAVVAFTEAYRLLEEAPVLNADDVASRARQRELAVTLVNRARAQLGVGSAQEAEQDAKEAARIDPAYSRAKTVLAEAYQKQGRSAEAMALMQETAAGDKEVVALQRLPELLRASAWRGLRAYGLVFAVLALLLWLHRVLALDALLGRQPSLGAPEIQRLLSYTSGYGVASFHTRLRPDQIEDATRSVVLRTASPQEWSEFIGQAFGRNTPREDGKLLLLSWGDVPTQKQGKGKAPSAWLGVLAFVPKDAQPSLHGLPERAAFGRLVRLGHSGRTWVQKHFGLGSAAGGLLPLALHVQGTVADEQVLPMKLTLHRLVLVLVLLVASFFGHRIYVAAMSLCNVQRHPAVAALAESNGRFLAAVEKELCETAPEMPPRVVEDGRVIITMSWFIHMPGNLTFLSRLCQPLMTLTGMLGIAGGPRKAQGEGPRPPSGLLQNLIGVVWQLPNWFHLLRRSLPGTVQVSPLWEVQLGFRQDQAVPPKGGVILWDAPRGHFVDIIGELKDMEKLSREIATRQAVAIKVITSSAISESGGMQQQAEGGLDPRSMTLERCYEVLRLSREEVRAAQSSSKEEAKSLLARVFRLRVMEDIDAEKRKVEELTLALDVLMRRLSLSLEM